MGYQRKAGVSAVKVEGDVILIDDVGMKMITLNHLAGVIWDQLESPTALEGVLDVCSSEYPDVSAEVLEPDVRSFLDHATELGVIQPTES